MADDLIERLNSHSEAFDGLMALIPAKHYYAEDTSDQWQRKKQTKEEKRAARKAKLNPDSYKSAKDVMDENERKRKREMDEEAALAENLPNGGPSEDARGASLGTKAKRQKLGSHPKTTTMDGNQESDAQANPAMVKQAKAEKRKEKRLHKSAKKAARSMKKSEQAQMKGIENQSEGSELAEDTGHADQGDSNNLDDIDHIDLGADDLESAHESEDRQDINSPTSAPPTPHSPVFDTLTNRSASSSTSSPPPDVINESEQQELGGSEEQAASLKRGELTQAAQDALKTRLQARIEALRAARKADGIDGKPAKNRQELMEARRRKEQQRKAHKKELRMKAKQNELRTADAEAARLSGSNSPFSAHGIFSPRRENEPENNFSFGRVAFEDGQEIDSSLSGLLDKRKRKGPQDPRTALEAAKKRQSRIAGFDEAKRADIAEKDSWLSAKKRAYGEKIRDDTNLLKKTLKRKDNAKKKSEKEWEGRIAGVEKGKEIRQKKRDENIRKRKEEKGGAKGKKKPGATKGKNAKKRPGFEGSFKSKSKSS